MEKEQRLKMYLVNMAMLTAQCNINSLKYPSPVFSSIVLKVVANLIVELKNIGVVKPVVWLKRLLTDKKEVALRDKDNEFRYEAVITAIDEIIELFKKAQEQDATEKAKAKQKLKDLGFVLGD
jgi:hypothetical protein